MLCTFPSKDDVRRGAFHAAPLAVFNFVLILALERAGGFPFCADADTFRVLTSFEFLLFFEHAALPQAVLATPMPAVLFCIQNESADFHDARATAFGVLAGNAFEALS